MAINYLNSIDLNQNELLQGVVENQPNDASAGSSPVEGQLYFNTTAHVLKQYNGTAWVEVGGGVETLTTTDGTYIDLTPNSATAGAVTVTADLSAVDGTSVAATRFLSKDNTWDVPTYPSDANTTYTLSGVGSSDGTAGVSLIGSDSTTNNVLIIGGGTAVVTRSGNTITVAAADQYNGTVTSVAATHAGNAFTASIGNTSTINPSVDITMAGASTDYINGLGNLTVFPAIPQGDVTGIDAGTYISIADGGTATPTVNALGTTAATASRLVARDASGYGYVVTPASGDSSTKIPTTEWVNQKLTGLLEFKGGFSANTGVIANTSPAEYLTDNAARVAVEVGDYYVVTIAGDFFGNAATPLTPGDSVIVQTAAVAGASVEGDFIVVQSDTDLATNSTVGLMTINPVGVGGITSNIVNGIATITNTDTNATNTATDVITAGDLVGTVTHALGINTIVQTIDSSGNTVFCDISRTATTSVATITVAEANDITILVQKIG